MTCSVRKNYNIGLGLMFTTYHIRLKDQNNHVLLFCHL